MQSKTTILDGHVHIHDCFDVSDVFDRAHNNFAAQVGGSDDAFDGVLMLTESAGANWFGKLGDIASGGDESLGHWHISHTDEDESLQAKSAAGHTLTIIAGRQIVTAENLEVLALGLVTEYPDGSPIQTVIEDVQGSGALCILPWGFGKWTGNRGRIIRRILADAAGGNFFVGDNAGRLGLWPDPPEFDMATAKGIRILPGSDPFPYPDQTGRAGSYGFTLDAELATERPFETLRRALLDEDMQPSPYGRRERLLPFLKNQVAMQLRKFA